MIKLIFGFMITMALFSCKSSKVDCGCYSFIDKKTITIDRNVISDTLVIKNNI